MDVCFMNIISQYQGHFFNEYNMDGLSEESNEIYLDLAPDNLLRSLKSSQNAKSIKIKLTKKHTPCLTFEVELVRNDTYFVEKVSNLASLWYIYLVY